MDFTFAGMVIISWLGILGGFLLSMIAPEEVPIAKKWIVWLQRLLWLLAAVFLMMLVSFQITETIFISAVFLAIVFFEYQIPFAIRQMVLGISMVFASFNLTIAATLSSVLFLFFLLQGIRVFPESSHKKWHLVLQKLKETSIYPLSALLLFIALSFL